MIHNAIEHSTVQRNMTNSKTAQHGAAEPLARYIAIDTCIASARRTVRCRENCSTLHIWSVASSRFGTESALELELVERPARFDCGQLWATHGLRQLEFEIQISSARSRMPRTT